MSAEQDSRGVSLRPWPAATKDGLTQVDLFQQLHQLAEQRGHLRSVTEKSLQDEIDSGKDVTGDVVEGVEKESEEDEDMEMANTPPRKKHRPAPISTSRCTSGRFDMIISCPRRLRSRPSGVS